MCNGYGIAFDGATSSHSDNRTDNILVFGEGKVLVLMEALLHQRKGLALLLVNQIQNFPWPCIIVVIIVICMLKEKKSIILK